MEESDFVEWETQMHANEPGHELSGFDAVKVYDWERRLCMLDEGVLPEYWHGEIGL